MPVSPVPGDPVPPPDHRMWTSILQLLLPQTLCRAPTRGRGQSQGEPFTRLPNVQVETCRLWGLKDLLHDPAWLPPCWPNTGRADSTTGGAGAFLRSHHPSLSHRQPTSLQSGTHALADEERLRKDYPIAYAARELAISREEADLAERGVQYLVLRFGNRHTLIPRARKNKHEWEFFVGLDGGEETRFIDHVEVRLHQAYRPSSLRLEQPPFMTRHRTSTGSEVRALVTFRSEYQRPPLWLVWSLDLQGNGSSQTLEFELQKGGLPSNHDLETGAAVVPSDWWESRGSMLSMLGTEDWQAALLGLMWQSGRWSGPGEASEDDSWTPGEGEEGEESDADWNAGVDEEGEED
uniref:YEATS domain-containing protein n=1 Tax=Auxenochlorella protothecoides TaxID=3075 RepID=A0A1D1ZVM1_AUXPR